MRHAPVTWDDVKDMRSNAHFLIRRDASIKKPSPLLDVEDVRRLAQKEIDDRDAVIDDMKRRLL